MTSQAKSGKTLVVPLVIVGVLFFVMGFGVGISGFLTPFLQNAFNLSVSQSYLVTAAIFSAFVVFGAPAGWVIKKFGYRMGMLFAFFIMAAGMLLFVPSAKMSSFPIFLLALFVGGIGNTLLQAAVNPYVTIIGPKESAAMRMCLMGIMNKAAWWLSSLFLGLFLNLNNVQLSDIILPFYIVTAILVGLGVFMYFAPLPEVKAEGEDESEAGNEVSSYASSKTSILQFPHLLMGVAALFLYVGIETLPMVSIIGYAKSVFGDVAGLESFSKYVTIGLVIGYIFGVLMIPKIISQTTALKAFAIIGIVASGLLIYLPGEYGVYCMAFLGFANSLMWPAIWPLAIADLGKFTKTGSSLLVMGIVGGAVVPFIFGMLVDAFKVNEVVTAASYQSAFWIFIPAYLFILYFGVKGHKLR
ncbi:MFS transporter [Alistipes sp. ZOR0009]|jgi:fucose permease|uniref:MFS transporter n=1 Tax=Alistipes sp. ZOR0009 TaxID=1339253 RepID=UPI0006460C76|nr:MFS transporter [Alistipes sp. ZOR0009]